MRKRAAKKAKVRAIASQRTSIEGSSEPAGGEETIATIDSAAGLILAVTENRNWIEVFFEGDSMHTKTVDLPSGGLFNIYIEEIPHKTTVYEHPRTMIFFNGPCNLRITRGGDRVIVTGIPPSRNLT